LSPFFLDRIGLDRIALEGRGGFPSFQNLIPCAYLCMEGFFYVGVLIVLLTAQAKGYSADKGTDLNKTA